MYQNGMEFRPATEEDRPGIRALMEACFQWVPRGQHEEFFRWKHHANPFGPSIMWVAAMNGRIVGLRSYLRWQFLRDDIHRVQAVRAVDTATHPDCRGRGIFRQLTRLSLHVLQTEGVAFVFNNPNSQSLPGYLSLGWSKIGRLTVLMRPLRFTGIRRVIRARKYGPQVWSSTSKIGKPASQALNDIEGVRSLLAAYSPQAGLATHRTAEYLQWRYGFGPLGYRAVIAEEGLRRGVALVRVRGRGPAAELVVAEVLVANGDKTVARSLLRRIVASSGADIAVRLATDGSPIRGFFPLPGQGPILICRGILDDNCPEHGRWRLSLGDIELL